MRERVQHNGMTVQAVAGTHAVLLGFDLDDLEHSDALGFAIRRTDHTEDETYWLRGMKVFESVVPHPAPGQSFSLRRHPVQSFQWGDYTAKPEHRYTYRVATLLGPVDAPRLGPFVDVDVVTEAEDDGRHGVWFNRGVAGSQAWNAKFGEPSTELADPRSSAWAWLSRGLGEAFTRMCETATDASWSMRGAFYEFTWADGLQAFGAARRRDVDVRLVVHGRDRDADGSESDRDTTAAASRAAAAHADIDDAITWRVAPSASALQHNKFLVLLHDGEPVAVWTGSTNLTQGAIYGHSNVGHLIHDRDIASAFLAYWEQLASDATTAQLRDWTESHNAETAPLAATVFSPRSRQSDLLDRYADRFDRASSSVHLTGAFGLNAVFRERLSHARDYPRTVLLDTRPDFDSRIPTSDENVRVVWGAHLTSPLDHWAAETLTGFNAHVRYIHLKAILIDPLTDDPAILTGSANYSVASTTTNEENTVVLDASAVPGVPGAPAGSPALSRDALKRVSDIYLTEYHRLFMHHVFRAFAQPGAAGPDSSGRRSLTEDPSWMTPYLTRWRARQRHLFAGTGDAAMRPSR